MTLCLAFNSRIAVQTNLFLMLFLAVGLQLDIDSFIYLAVSGYTGIVYMRQMSSRSDIFKTGILVSIINVLMILIINTYRDNLSVQILNEFLYGIGSGIFSAVLANAMLMLWEMVFNILTPFKLLEMSNPSDELMQKLITEAPGTYHHSLVVSNMAESAAKQIGANMLLARVGAYYHDIGKAEKAVYFKENQTDIKNPHDFIAPEVSAKIIKNHVSDGIYLAEKDRVPEEIIDFIRMHHGTSEIAYFKAKAEENGYHGDEDFHYQGILPRTKETSIVMLADSVEAAVRSLDDRSAEDIKNMIDSIVNQKIDGGQMKDSPLSFADIEQIKLMFFDVLTGVYHSRIKYPNQMDKTEKNEND
jgi:putative nucleotidyltransferase with HDIG domain